VVEDEFVTARHIADSLKELGYGVAGLVATGEEAVKKAAETQPDLVLMDIRLKGPLDGIQAAEQIASLQIPIVYLTSYSDDRTVERAKITEPYGYLIKPFTDTELKTTLEMAIYKHRRERSTKAQAEWFRKTLVAITDGVITTNTEGFITFMNPAAEFITGWGIREAFMHPLSEVLHQFRERSGIAIDNPAIRAIREGNLVSEPADTVLTAKTGTRWHLEETSSPIRDDRGSVIGAVVVFRPRTADQMPSDETLESIKRVDEAFRAIAPELLKEIDLGYLVKGRDGEK
jgi:PAS domain S-box-containing protein